MMAIFRRVIPSSFAECVDAWLLLAGGTLGWFVSPTLWLAAILPRWWAFLLMTAAQESAYDRHAVGGAGELGMVQFLPATAARFMGSDWKASSVAPFWTGYYSARYVQAALLHDVRWWLIAAPIIGPMYVRWLWTHGPSSGSLDAAWAGDSRGDTLTTHWAKQEVGKAAWLVWGSLAALAGLVWYLRIYRSGRRK